MVLPGIQALFGFQLIAVFSEGFSGRLAPALQRLHLAATILTCIAIALVMTPAAYHRLASPRAVSDSFIRLSTRLLVCSMLPLAASISLELYLVASLILTGRWVFLLPAALFVLFLGFWYVLPLAGRARRPGARRKPA